MRHVLLGCLGWLALTSLALSQPSLNKAQSLDSNTVLLEVQLDGRALTESLNAFQLGKKTFLPLGEMSGLLTIAIRAYPAEGAARGFVRGEGKTFSLNVANRIAAIAEQSTTFDAADVIIQEDDIYVESKLLASWLLVDFEVDLSSLSAKAKPRVPLPIQGRFAREARSASLNGPAPVVELNYPRIDNPYKLVDIPFVDQTLSLGAQRGNGNNSNSATSTTYVRGDLAGLQASLYNFESNQSGSRQSRFTVGRSDPRGELLGPLGARAFALGNVSVPGVANISSGSDIGNGFSVSNLPLDRPTRFGSQSLQGDLPPGWDVELYLNNVLIGYQQAQADGKYSFNDIRLVYGANEIRLVFHGPQGQLRVERKSFLLDGSQNEPGTFYYNLASNRDTLGLRHSAATAEYGISKTLTGTLGLVDFDTANGQRSSYTSVGLQGYTDNAVLFGNLTRQSNGGSLYELTARTRIGSVSAAFSHLQLKDFTSAAFPVSTDPVKRRDDIRLDGLLMTQSLGDLPFTMQLRRDRLQSGASILDARGLLSTSIALATVSNLLHVSSGNGTRSIDGTLQISGNIGSFRVGGQASYLIKPETKLSALAISADQALGPGYVMNLSAGYTFTDSTLRLASSLTRSFGDYAVALTGGISSKKEIFVGLQIFTGIARDPRRSQWVFDAVPLAESGSVSARAFIDRNGNGILDPGEETVNNVGFLVNTANHPARTDATGNAYIGHLLSNRETDISINPSTIENPQLTPALKGVRVVPRPGNVTSVDFPLAQTGEIDGTVSLSANGRKRGVGNVLVELVDASGKVVAESRSGSDGFFIVVEVLPGTYTLRINEAQLEDLKLRYSGAKSLTMSPQGTFINGQDFLLEIR